MTFSYLDNTESLAAAVEHAHSEGIAGLDAEFMHRTTYYAIPALYQMRVADRCYLIDPLAIKDMECFGALLEAPEVLKIMHGCQQDIVLFARHLEVKPNNLFDTQLAAAFAGFYYPIGYQKLVSSILHVKLKKAEQRSDWMRRPLSCGQLQYAAEDVHYLLPLYLLLSKRVAVLKRTAWLQEETQSQHFSSNTHQNLFWRNAFAGRLRELPLLRHQLLFQWREQQAKTKDRPRNWIAEDKLLYELAKRPEPESVFSDYPKIRPWKREQMLSVIDEANDAPKSQWPYNVIRPLVAKEKDLLKSLGDQIRKLALVYDLPEILLATKKTLTEFIVAGQDARLPKIEFRGWRAEVFSRALIEQVYGDI